MCMWPIYVPEIHPGKIKYVNDYKTQYQEIHTLTSSASHHTSGKNVTRGVAA